MGAVLREQADLPSGVPKDDQVLAEHGQPDRVAVRLEELLREHHGHPVLPHEVAHGGAGADVGEESVVFGVQHARAS